MFIESYFQTAAHLFEQYEVQMPLHLFLKEYFRNNKKFGSRDRKYISELLYGIYRLGKANEHLRVRDRLLIGSFLSGRLPILFFEKVNKELAIRYEAHIQEKMAYVIEAYQCDFSVPFALTTGISEEQFIQNLYAHPRVFIRIRKNHTTIEEKLIQQAIAFQRVSANCLSFDASIKLNELLDPSDYVIQDYASQLTGDHFKPASNESWWDCCTASGGKSIMLLDKNSSIKLTATDIRETILKNLHERMRVYGYESHYVSFNLDVTKDVSGQLKNKFDAIVCDAPCSGAGTWGRSPEQYYFFTQEKLAQFATLQSDIMQHIIDQLKPDGKLYYITCSVLKHENEEIMDTFIQQNPDYSYIAECIDTTTLGGDMMYIAEVRKKA
jgi:16S rRNA (cytosine967-C5)-methyltransferase